VPLPPASRRIAPAILRFFSAFLGALGVRSFAFAIPKQLPKSPIDSKLLPPNKAAPTSVITNQRAANKHQTKMSRILKVLCLLLGATVVHRWRTGAALCESEPGFTPSLAKLLSTAMQYNRT
jgi:hypothetical protein